MISACRFGILLGFNIICSYFAIRAGPDLHPCYCILDLRQLKSKRHLSLFQQQLIYGNYSLFQISYYINFHLICNRRFLTKTPALCVNLQKRDRVHRFKECVIAGNFANVLTAFIVFLACHALNSSI